LKALDVLTDIIKNKNLAKEYALQESKDLRVLSPKKDTALACLLSGIERVETIPTWVKTSWFNWIFYAMRMISDKEVDALAESMSKGLEEYKMAYFSQEFIESLPKEKRPAAEALLQPHLLKLKGSHTTMNETLKEWRI